MLISVPDLQGADEWLASSKTLFHAVYNVQIKHKSNIIFYSFIHHFISNLLLSL